MISSLIIGLTIIADILASAAIIGGIVLVWLTVRKTIRFFRGVVRWFRAFFVAINSSRPNGTNAANWVAVIETPLRVKASKKVANLSRNETKYHYFTSAREGNRVQFLITLLSKVENLNTIYVQDTLWRGAEFVPGTLKWRVQGNSGEITLSPSQAVEFFSHEGTDINLTPQGGLRAKQTLEIRYDAIINRTCHISQAAQEAPQTIVR
jgi:hypothetical protein